jgi:hypothetical protein
MYVGLETDERYQVYVGSETDEIYSLSSVSDPT